MQNLYLPRDAIYVQNDSKDRNRIERRCWSNAAVEIYYNYASFIGRYARDTSYAQGNQSQRYFGYHRERN